MAQIGIEEELMLAYQSGDKQAGEKLYVLIKPALYTFLYRFNRDEQLSIDLVQDTFLTLERKKHMYEPEKGKIKTYLFQIGYRLMINKLNRRKKWRTLFAIFSADSGKRIFSRRSAYSKRSNFESSRRAKSSPNPFLLS